MTRSSRSWCGAEGCRHFGLFDLARPREQSSLRHPHARRRPHAGQAARHRDHEALVGPHVRHHGEQPRQFAGAGAAEAGVPPAMSSAFSIKEVRVFTLAPVIPGRHLFQAGRREALAGRQPDRQPDVGLSQIPRQAVELGHRRAGRARRRDRDGGWLGRCRHGLGRHARGLADPPSLLPLPGRARTRATSTASGTSSTAPRCPMAARA